MRFSRVIPYLLVIGFMPLVFSGAASADSISGLLDFNYNNTSMTTKDLTGVTSHTRSDGFQQRYSLAFDKMFYPSIVLSGGGLFEDSSANGNTDGVSSKSDTTRLSPYADLKLTNPVISSGIGYRRRVDTAKSNGISSPDQIQDMYTANLGWRPVGFPSIDVFYTKRYLYDDQKSTQNIQTDNYTWTASYREIRGLELNYNGNYSTVADILRNTETQSLTNAGRVSYSGSLFNNRVLYHTGYNISVQNTTITANGSLGGTFYQPPATPGTQLFAVTPNNSAIPPTTVTNGLLSSFASPNLVINNPLGTQNNIGLSFVPNTPAIDTIFLPILSKQDPANPANRIPPSINDLTAFSGANPGVFAFQVYTNDPNDTTGTLWVLRSAAPTVTVGNNPGNPGSGEVGFIITFPQQSASFIKVVQTPPSSSATIVTPPDVTTIDSHNIIAANIQSFKTVQITTPGTSIKSSNISGILDMSLKALLLDDPNLAYDMSFSFNHNSSDQESLTTSYIINNGLSVAHRFTDVLAVTARVTDEFSSDAQERIRNAISYNAALTATPLPTLNHSLVYGGRVEFHDDQTTLTNSIYLNNSAELYKGISLNLGAGYNSSTQASGQSTDSVSITMGSDIVPNKDMSLSISYQDLMSHQSGGGQPDKSSYNRAATATATYRPFEGIYVTGGISVTMQNDRDTVTLQNYAVSWSPFRGGDLQFNFAYSQAYNSSENEKDTNISPSLRWNIRTGSTLDVSYNIHKTSSNTTGTTDANSFGAHLRITF